MILYHSISYYTILYYIAGGESASTRIRAPLRCGHSPYEDSGFQRARFTYVKCRGSVSESRLPTGALLGCRPPQHQHLVDSSIILILRGGILMSVGNFPETLSQGILVGILGVWTGAVRIGTTSSRTLKQRFPDFQKCTSKGMTTGRSVETQEFLTKEKEPMPCRHMPLPM